MATRTTSRPRKVAVSPPLPLPVRFTLLPSQLPNRALTPMLYTMVNGIPVYLTLCPTHPPHLSILPLILAIIPTAPIHIIRLLPPGSISTNLHGLAPWEDIWVSWVAARQLCLTLGIDKLFWDEQGRGMMGDGVESAVSWEEEHMICHNWIPSEGVISPSAYSLETLLSTPFPGINIISNDRYIATRVDAARKANFRAVEYENPSIIRHDSWQQVWPLVLRWSISAWEEFLRYPSKPPISITPNESDASLSLPSIISQLLLSLPSALTSSSSSSLTSSKPAYIPTPHDLAELLEPPNFDILSIFITIIWSWSYALLGMVKGIIHFRPRFSMLFGRKSVTSAQGGSDTQPYLEVRRKRLFARVNLGIVEVVGWVIVQLWILIYRQSRQSRVSHHTNGPKGDGETTIILHAPNLMDMKPVNNLSPPLGHRTSSGGIPSKSALRPNGIGIGTAPTKTKNRKKTRGGSKKKYINALMMSPVESDFEVLEKKRGGSPLASDINGKSPKVKKVEGNLGGETGGSDDGDETDQSDENSQTSGGSQSQSQTAVTRTSRKGSITKLRGRRPSRQFILTGHEEGIEVDDLERRYSDDNLPHPEDIFDDFVEGMEEVMEYAEEVGHEVKEKVMVMKSEDTREWWMYYTMIGVVFVAYLMGNLPF